MKEIAQKLKNEKSQLIAELDEKLGWGWKTKIAQRADFSLNSVVRWARNDVKHSLIIERTARQLLQEEQQIRELFPSRK